MSTKPTFVEGVEVHDVDLQTEVTQRISEDTQRMLDTCQTGVVSGLLVTINGGDQTKVDIAAGRGYAPNGQLVVLPAAVIGLALADYTIANYICLVYTETGSNPRAHESNGTAPNTLITGSYRVKVVTPTQYAALPTTSTDMSVNAQDRMLIVASVTGNGFTGPVPNNLVYTNFVEAIDLASETSFGAWTPLSVELISALTVTGVEYGHLFKSNPTLAIPTGTAQIKLTVGSPATLQWKAFGEAFGAAVNIPSANSYTLVSGGASAARLLVYASPELFPISGGPYTDDLRISQQLYISPLQAPLSPRDIQHRNALGSLATTPTNIHGTRGTDISQVLRVQQGIVLGDGMPNTATHALLPRLFMSTSTAGGADRDLFSMLRDPATGVATRVYRNADDEIETTVNAYWDETANQWHKDIEGTGATLQLQNALGISFYTRAPAAASTWTWTSADIGYSAFSTGLSAQRQVTVTGTGNSASEARSLGFTQTIASATSTLWQVSKTTDLTTGLVHRRYVRVDGGNNMREITTINASFDGANWNRDTSAMIATRRDFFGGGEQLLYVNATATASWAEASWVLYTQLGNGPSAFTELFDHQLAFGAGLSSNSNPATTTGFTNTLVAKNVCKAWLVGTWVNGGDPTLDGGFNITSVTSSAVTKKTTITFATGMDSANWSGCAQIMSTYSAGSAVFGTGGAIAYLGDIAANTCSLEVSSPAGVGSQIDPRSASLAGIRFGVQFFGTQA